MDEDTKFTTLAEVADYFGSYKSMTETRLIEIAEDYANAYEKQYKNIPDLIVAVLALRTELEDAHKRLMSDNDLMIARARIQELNNKVQDECERNEQLEAKLKVAVKAWRIGLQGLQSMNTAWNEQGLLEALDKMVVDMRSDSDKEICRCGHPNSEHAWDGWPGCCVAGCPCEG